MKKIRYIYKITCLCGSFKDHYYIGQRTTSNIDDSIYTGSGNKITCYFKHYEKIEGETYIKEILAYADSREELNELEAQYIGDKYESDPLCLNLVAGGSVHYVSEETRQKMSESAKHKPPVTKETLLKMSLVQKGKKRTKETCKKISEALKGKKPSEETRRKLVESHKGISPSAETRKKLSEAIKGYHWKLNPETGKREYYK